MKQPQQTDCTPESRRAFGDEFKRQAIALTETGRPVRHLAREIEVTASMVYAWKRKFGFSLSPSTPAPPYVGFLQEDNHSLKAELASLRHREEILKKAPHPLRTKRDRFQRIEAMKADYPIAQLCMAFRVSRGGFYAWSNHSPSRRVQEEQRLTEQILTLHTRSRHTYGSPRIRIELQASGMKIGRRGIARIMRQQRIVGRCRKRRSPRTDATAPSGACHRLLLRASTTKPKIRLPLGQKERSKPSLHKKKRFATTFCDLAKHRVFEDVPGKSIQDLLPFLHQLKGKERVRAVCIDLSSSYQSLIRRFFPNVQILADRLHVVRLSQHHFIEVARKLAPELAARKGRLGLLREAHPKLTTEQKALFEGIFQTHPGLRIIYDKMHEIRDLLNQKHQTKFHCRE